MIGLTTHHLGSVSAWHRLRCAIPPGIEPKAPGERLPGVAPEVRRSWMARLRRDRAGALGALARRGGGGCVWWHKAHRGGVGAPSHGQALVRLVLVCFRRALRFSGCGGRAFLSANRAAARVSVSPHEGLHGPELPPFRDPDPRAPDRQGHRRGSRGEVRRHRPDDPPGPDRALRYRPARPGARRRDDPLGGDRAGLRRPAQPRLGREGCDGADGGGADPGRRVDLHEYRHDHRGGGAGAAEAPQPDGGDQQPQRRQHPRHLAQLRGDRRGRYPAALGRGAGGGCDGGVHRPVQGGLRDHRLGGGRSGWRRCSTTISARCGWRRR